MDLDIFFKGTDCLRAWLQRKIYGASLLANVVHIGLIENLVFHTFRSGLSQNRGQVGLL